MPQPGADWPDSAALGSTRLCSARYGSTPALSRPTSKLAIYASNGDLRAQLPSYSSLDRRLLSRPPPPPPPPPRHQSGAGVTSPGARAGSVDSGSPTLSTSSSNSDRGLTCSWGFEEAELASLRLTAQRNEQALVRAHRDKERAWERELRRLQAAHDSRMRGAAQRAQLDQTSQAADELRAQVTALRAQLEEKTADVAHLSAQISDMKEAGERARLEMSREREVWAGEKERVLRYQRQLQRNYVIMFRRARALDERAAATAQQQGAAAQQ